MLLHQQIPVIRPQIWSYSWQKWVSKTAASVYLAKSALHPSQKVIITGSDAVSAVDVVNLKSQFLNLLEVVIQRENLAKDWVQVALDHFCPVQLRENMLNELLNVNTSLSNVPNYDRLYAFVKKWSPPLTDCLIVFYIACKKQNQLLYKEGQTLLCLSWGWYERWLEGSDI